MSLKPLAVLLLIVLAAIAQPVLAQNYTMTYTIEAGAYITGDLSWTANGTPESTGEVYIGPQVITFQGTPPSGYTQNVDAYCVDLYNDQTTSMYSVNPVPLTTTVADPNAATDGLTPGEYDKDIGEAAYLYDTYNPIVQAATSTTKTVDGAELQLAIWDVMTGGTMTVSSAGGLPTGTTINDIETAATDEYNLASNQSGTGTLFQIQRTSSSGQDMVGPGIVPEASSLTLLVFALAAPLTLLALRARRRSVCQAV